jgi:DNA repair protein RadC
MKRVVKYSVQLIRESENDYNIDTVLDASNKTKDFIYEVFQTEKWHNERFGVICLDNQNKVIGTHIVTEGTIDEASVHVREIAIRTLLNNAPSVILFHNHIGNSQKASQADIDSTSRVKKALKTLDIRVLDHVIITGNGNHLSMAENGLL